MKAGNIVRYVYRPFDNRWLYWEPETKLLDEKRSDYRPHVFHGNIWITAAEAIRKGETEAQHAVITSIGSYHLIERASLFFPAYLRDDHDNGENGEIRKRPNLSKSVAAHLGGLGLGVEDLFHHIVAVLHSPAYRSENAGALRLDWPHIPLPSNKDVLATSADLGHRVAALLDPERPVLGVTSGGLHVWIKALGVPARVDGKDLSGPDFAVTAGWGYAQKSGAIMPSGGTAEERDYTPDEIAAFAAGRGRLGVKLAQMMELLGERTFNVHLNTDAYWSNVPAKVWAYKLGGYQVVKKWLSYRERDILGRSLNEHEVLEVSNMIRRIASIILMGDQMDANYRAVRDNAICWPKS